MHHQQQSSDATIQHQEASLPSMASRDQLGGQATAAANHGFLDDPAGNLSASGFSHASSSASGTSLQQSPYLQQQQQLPPSFTSDYAGEPGRMSGHAPRGYSEAAGNLVSSESAYSHPPRGYSEAAGSSAAAYAAPPARARTRRKKKPAPPELLVIVRPPPSKDRNPLNLQIQLVVPQLPPTRTSTESSRDSSSVVNSGSGGTLASQLQRRGSTSSSRSGRSEMTNASTASSASNRRVTPLYNLAFHSILPTTVADAGTDQRVAKYSKRGGVDLDGFGILEPRELIYGINDVESLEASASGVHSGTGLGASPHIGGHESVDESMLSPKPPGSDPGVEPPASAFEPPTSFEAMTPEARSPEQGVGAKFMRRFKGLSFNGPKAPSSGQSVFSGGSGAGAGGGEAGAPTSAPSITSFLSGLGRATKASGRPSTSAGAASTVSAAGGPPGGGPSSTTLLSTTTPGPSASVVTRLNHNYGTDIAALAPGAGITESGRRTHGYFWTVKKYTRRVADEEGNMPQVPLGPDGQNPVLKNVWKRFNTVNRMGGEEKHPHPSSINVRFEWTREGRSTSASVARTSDVGGPSAGTNSSSDYSNGNGAGLLGRSSTLSDAARKRLSGISIGSGVVGAGAGGPSSSSRLPRTTLRPPADRRVSASRSSSRPGVSIAASDADGASPRQSTDASTHGSIAPSDDGAHGGSGDPASVVRGRNGRVIHGLGQVQPVQEDRADSEVSGPSAPGTGTGTGLGSTGPSSSAVDDGASDSGNVSDPEDSETPWSCHLVLGASTRIPIGTLSPAPHHPKVVAQLAVPFPLPDLSQTGLGADAAGLTREEIKDVICVTCLHLVLRESFGGLGRVRRKGDRM